MVASVNKYLPWNFYGTNSGQSPGLRGKNSLPKRFSIVYCFCHHQQLNCFLGIADWISSLEEEAP